MKEKIRLTTLQTVQKGEERKERKNQLPSIKFQDEPQLGKHFSAGMESELEKLFIFQLIKSLPLRKISEINWQ